MHSPASGLGSTGQLVTGTAASIPARVPESPAVGSHGHHGPSAERVACGACGACGRLWQKKSRLCHSFSIIYRFQWVFVSFAEKKQLSFLCLVLLRDALQDVAIPNYCFPELEVVLCRSKTCTLQPFFMGMISSWKDLSQTAEQLPGTESFPASAGLTAGSLFVHLSINIFEKNYLF